MAKQSETNTDFDKDGSIILGGSSNAYTATTARSITGYYAGLRIFRKAAFAKNGSATLYINGIGANTIKKSVSTNLASGDIANGQYYDFLYYASNDTFQLLDFFSIANGSITSA